MRQESRVRVSPQRTPGALLLGRVVARERVGRSYGRAVARVSLDGRDAVSELVGMSAARWWPRGAREPD